MRDKPRIYRSTDPGAPQLSGQPGSFVALMDAVLVDGYGSGASAKAPLGWIRAFSGTNRRAYRNDPAHYSGEFVRFNDANAMYVLVDGYEAMTGIDAGTERFDSISTAWPKSSASSSASRGWIVIGTARCFYFMVQSNGTQWTGFFAGDMYTMGPNDTWRFAYAISGSTTYVNSTNLFRSVGGTSNYSVVFSRSSVGVVGAGAAYGRASLFFGNGTPGNASGFAHPLPTTGGLLLSRLFVLEGGSANSNPPRAMYPGVWAPENASVPDDTIYSNVTGVPAGTELLCQLYYSPGSGRVMFDLTNDW